MATDVESALHAPITPRKPRVNWRKLWPALLVWFNRIGGTLLGLIFAGLITWLFLVEDRLGGEPQGFAQIDSAVDPQSEPSTPGGMQADGLAQPLPPAAQAVPGQPQILRVPTGEDEPSADELQAALDPTGLGLQTDFDSQGRLPAVANAGLVERFDANSFVPVLGPGGERALDAYARPVERGTVLAGQPRIAIIVGGMGLSQTATQRVIDQLPGAFTLSFAPYGNSLSRWTMRARQAGHEYLIEVPMEPFDYPNNDPGPHTLQVGLDTQANLERMHWALSRVQTPIGLMNYMGGRFASDDAALTPIVRDAIGRGLMVVDDGRSARTRLAAVASEDEPAIRADVVIDARTERQAIDNRLVQLESMARQRGSAIGVASALPLTLTALEDWASSLADKGIALVPVSSLVR